MFMQGFLSVSKVNKLPPEECHGFKAKLRFRRALARGEPGPERDLEQALEDLREAAHLMPQSADVRKCLANCKRLLRGEEEVKESEEGGPK